ncbi:DnaJ domain-containing protein [Halogeometricum rufum]|uniref:DnaJ domain-containing protein n=1 Tax=Halogeometricum rufum TaxID=553469 RepID=A0A1I6GFB8_9EURY|nr:J domain-containing protein [Halogeometricum rufum]SFR40905.1 DnaJ domain-containing protein [Halogeometricum rufum]
MLLDWVSLVPGWLVFGVVGGLVASVFVAGVFVVGGRLFPDEPISRGSIDGAGRRRMEIRDYLREIGEPFAEDHPIHGETVEFYLPGRDVAVTFDAQAYFRLERAGTYTVLCEHEMPARGLGRRFPFEVPELEQRPPAPDDPVATAFDHLDLPQSASPSEVKSAYREKVKTAHPDHGGSQSEFQRLQEAYATAREHAERAIAS